MERITILDRVCGCPLYDQIWHWKSDQHGAGATAMLIQFFYQFAKDINGGNVIRVQFDRPTIDTFSGAGPNGTLKKRGQFSRYGAMTINRNSRRRSVGEMGRIERMAGGGGAGAGGGGGTGPGGGTGGKAGANYSPNPSATSAPAVAGSASPHQGSASSPTNATSSQQSFSNPSNSSSSSSSSQMLEMHCAHNDQIIAAMFTNRSYNKDRSAIISLIRDEFTSAYSSNLTELKSQFSQVAKNGEDAMMNETFLPQFTEFQQTLKKLQVAELDLSNITSVSTDGTDGGPGKGSGDYKLDIGEFSTSGLPSSNGPSSRPNQNINAPLVTSSTLHPGHPQNSSHTPSGAGKEGVDMSAIELTERDNLTGGGGESDRPKIIHEMDLKLDYDD